jgi:hypothetical protein
VKGKNPYPPEVNNGFFGRGVYTERSECAPQNDHCEDANGICETPHQHPSSHRVTAESRLTEDCPRHVTVVFCVTSRQTGTAVTVIHIIGLLR